MQKRGQKRGAPDLTLMLAGGSAVWEPREFKFYRHRKIVVPKAITVLYCVEQVEQHATFVHQV